MNLFFRTILIILPLFSFYGCKVNYNLDKAIISNKDDFSIKDNNTEINNFQTFLQKQNEVRQIKVIYKKRTYTFERFNKKIGFNNISNFKVIKDSLAIVNNYNIKDCKVLLLIY